MSSENWEHVMLAFIAALPATIAAISSLRNGREQSRVRKELAEVNGKVTPRKPQKKTMSSGVTVSNPDWYVLPDV